MPARDSEPGHEFRDIRCSHSESLPALLTQLRLSVLISTYQTGHLVVVAARQGRLVADVSSIRTGHGHRGQAGNDRRLHAARKSGSCGMPRTSPPNSSRAGSYDACFLARTAHFTDDIQAHESAWVGSEFWVVNTLFSCLAALHPAYQLRPALAAAVRFGFAPRRPLPSERAGRGGRPAALRHGPGGNRFSGRLAGGEGDGRLPDRGPQRTTCGPRPGLAALAAGGRQSALLSPLGPRARWRRSIPSTGQVTNRWPRLPGVARGLALHGGFAFVGLSKARPTLEGVPIVARRDELQCGLWVVDLRTGAVAAHLEFRTGVEEIFDVQVLPGITFPYVSGPWAERDTGQPLWTVPPDANR